MNQTLFSLVQLYDNEWPRGLRRSKNPRSNIELMGDILQTVANAPKDDLPVLQSKIRDLFSHATKLEIKGE